MRIGLNEIRTGRDLGNGVFVRSSFLLDIAPIWQDERNLDGVRISLQSYKASPELKNEYFGTGDTIEKAFSGLCLKLYEALVAAYNGAEVYGKAWLFSHFTFIPEELPIGLQLLESNT